MSSNLNFIYNYLFFLQIFQVAGWYYSISNEEDFFCIFVTSEVYFEWLLYPIPFHPEKNWSEPDKGEFRNLMLIFKAFFIWLCYYLRTYFLANKIFVCRVAIKSKFCVFYCWDFMNQDHPPGLSYYYTNKYKCNVRDLAHMFNY